MPIQLTEDEFTELVAEAVASLPPKFGAYLENLTVDVQPAPTPTQTRKLKLRRGNQLLGLYQGVPLTKKSVAAGVDWPERITIFQRNIESVCDSRRQVVARVRQTVLHEIGHHFGLDESDLREAGYG